MTSPAPARLDRSGLYYRCHEPDYSRVAAVGHLFGAITCCKAAIILHLYLSERLELGHLSSRQE